MDRTNPPSDDALGIVAFTPLRVLARRKAEENHRGNAEVVHLARFPYQAVHRQLGDAGHAGNRGRNIVTVHDEHRINEIVRRQNGFAQHPAPGRRPAQASETVLRKRHPSVAPLIENSHYGVNQTVESGGVRHRSW